MSAAVIVLLGAAALALSLTAADVAKMPGFSAQGAAAENATEHAFRDSISAAEIMKFHRYLTSEPHPAGSARNNDLAKWMAEQWRAQGLEDVTIHEYDVLNSSPREISLEMIKPKHFRASLREDSYSVDPDTSNPKVDGAYLGYSASGEVTAPVVYAHSGNPEDYDYLRQQGIDVRGKIVLVRYSLPYSYRGFKAYTAEKLGAAAILIYSDPAEDGYTKGAVYPDGPWGPESHIQRGAITYDFLEPGDPLTPGYASVPGAPRIPIEQAKTLPKIMGVPLSWRDVKPLLEKMDGPAAPAAWQGGLPIKYRIGGGRVVVHLKVDMDTRVQPYYVTEARIRGSEAPDEWVILGNHRDAWVYGAVDPSSGTAAMLEMTRGLGKLLQKGIRPKRTLVFCSWDGEEYALTGSTEWAEQYADELKKKAVAYLNVDEATSGKDFQGDAVGSLAPLLVNVSRTLPAPSGATLYDEWKLSRQAQLGEKQPVADFDLANTRIGSGSDHTVFLNFLGIPVMGLTFVGPYGVYHSLYDDFFWMNHFGDPEYRYHQLMSQLWGVLALRLANAEILPFDFESYGQNIRQFVVDLNLASRVNGHMDLGALQQHVADFEAAGRELNAAAARAIASGRLDASQAAQVNQELMEVERNWCNPEGMPGRPWFKHSLYATRYTYAHLELPGLTEAAEAENWPVLVQQTTILEGELEKNTALLQQIKSELNSISGASKP
ncbi:MAG: M28 family metallopeptidase [Candidatus Acidiferrales bacterium]